VIRQAINKTDAPGSDEYIREIMESLKKTCRISRSSL